MLLRLDEVGEVLVDVVVVDKSPLGFKFILGMNVIKELGGVTIYDARHVRFNSMPGQFCGLAEAEANERSPAATGVTPTESPGILPPSEKTRKSAEPSAASEQRQRHLSVEGEDFEPVYDPVNNKWLAEWKWSEKVGPRDMQNRVGSYSVSSEYRAQYEEELKRWVDEGWLVPYDATELGEPKGLIPLMAVVQEKKQKVRPVMDYRELNEYIEAYTADADVCAEKLRSWRRMGVDVAALDLKSAYLQIHVKQSLWSYQTVMFQGKRWALTRLGFGLNVALWW